MAERYGIPASLKAQWATIEEAAEQLAVCRQTVHRLIKQKALSKRKYLGNRTLVSRSSIQAFLAQFV